MSVVKEQIKAFKSRMISGTGWMNHIIAHHFGWCELSEYCQYENELVTLWNHVRNVMYMNDQHVDVALNSIVSATYKYTESKGSYTAIESIEFRTYVGKVYYFKLYCDKEGKISACVIPF